MNHFVIQWQDLQSESPVLTLGAGSVDNATYLYWAEATWHLDGWWKLDWPSSVAASVKGLTCPHWLMPLCQDFHLTPLDALQQIGNQLGTFVVLMLPFWGKCNCCLIWHHLAWQAQCGDVAPSSQASPMRANSRVVFWIRTCNSWSTGVSGWSFLGDILHICEMHVEKWHKLNLLFKRNPLKSLAGLWGKGLEILLANR